MMMIQMAMVLICYCHFAGMVLMAMVFTCYNHDDFADYCRGASASPCFPRAPGDPLTLNNSTPLPELPLFLGYTTPPLCAQRTTFPRHTAPPPQLSTFQQLLPPCTFLSPVTTLCTFSSPATALCTFSSPPTAPCTFSSPPTALCVCVTMPTCLHALQHACNPPHPNRLPATAAWQLTAWPAQLQAHHTEALRHPHIP